MQFTLPNFNPPAKPEDRVKGGITTRPALHGWYAEWLEEMTLKHQVKHDEEIGEGHS